MGNSLKIFDASYLVYVGTNSMRYNTNVKFGVNYGGLHFLCEKVFYNISIGNDVAVVFDSYTTKKLKFEEYKANRVPNAGIRIQLEILEEWLKKIGVAVFKEEGYEADDIIKYLVDANTDYYSNIDIYSGDADVYANIIRKGITVYGCSSKSPTVDSDNYATVAKRGEIVPYNAILPYFLVFGKPSNNIPPLRLEATNDNMVIFKDIIGFFNKQNVPNCDRSSLKNIRLWQLSKIGKLSANDLQAVVKQIELVYPKTTNDIDRFEYAQHRRSINKDAAIEFFAIFGLKLPALNLGWNRDLEAPKFNNVGVDRLKYYYNRMSSLYASESRGEIHLVSDSGTDEDDDYISSMITTDSFQ